MRKVPATIYGYVSKRVYASGYLLGLCVLAGTPLLASAQANTAWLKKIASESLSLLDAIVLALVVAAFFLFVWGVVVFISQTGNDASRASGKSKMVWGLLGLFILVSVWGIVAILQDMFDVYDESFGAPKATLK